MRFLFDFISPYAYIGWHRIHALADRHGLDVEPVPILFAALLDHWGHVGPAEIPSKRTYVFTDCLRTCKASGLAFAAPPAHPFNPLLALRVASVPLRPSLRRAVIDGLFAAVWSGGTGVTDPAVVSSILTEAGADPDVVLADATRPEGKSRLRDATQAAIGAGVFGVPSVLVDDALFWGVDSFPNLERHLSGEVVVRASDLGEFDVPEGAARRRGRNPRS